MVLAGGCGKKRKQEKTIIMFSCGHIGGDKPRKSLSKAAMSNLTSCWLELSQIASKVRLCLQTWTPSPSIQLVEHTCSLGGEGRDEVRSTCTDYEEKWAQDEASIFRCEDYLTSFTTKVHAFRTWKDTTWSLLNSLSSKQNSTSSNFLVTLVIPFDLSRIILASASKSCELEMSWEPSATCSTQPKRAMRVAHKRFVWPVYTVILD